MKIDFYHWGIQCPVIYESIELLKSYKDQVDVHFFDISQDYNLAKNQKIYFPFLTVFNDEKRWLGPLKANVLDAFISGETLEEKPYVIDQGTRVFTGDLVKLNQETMDLVREGCTLSNCQKSCQKKKEFLKEIGDGLYGILNLENGKVVGGVEYLPSLKVPYPVPKGEKIAFLTCIYHSSSLFDYKSAALHELETQLMDQYDEMIAITDEVGTFPNGNLHWFTKNGFRDLGVISTEDQYCKHHLVSKTILKS